MAHMVIFQTPDGNPGYNQFDTVEAAVAFVEQLRNEQGVSNARMFALEEIKFEFKPYYRVELAALTSGEPATATPPAPVAAPAEAPVAPAPAEAYSAPAPDDAADLSSPVGAVATGDGDAQLRRGLFGR